jgi:hypothetical protein
MTDHPDTPRSSTGDSYSSAQRPIDITKVLVQLRGASTDERELQIVYDTIILQAAAPAWTIREGVIYYNDRIYMPASSPLL